MTVMVTGANGFVGSVLMSRNPSFLGIDIRGENERVSICDATDKENLQKFIAENSITKVVHLAGVQFSAYIPKKSRLEYFKHNIDLAETIRSVARSSSISKIVYVSTDMVYGDKISTPLSEISIPNPIGEYGASKLAAEEILGKDSVEYGTVILRPRLILGVGRVGTIQKLARLIASPLPVILIGNGKNKYQFVAVEDVCSAIELSLDSGVIGVFNIGSDNPPSLNNLFKDTLSVLNRRKFILKVPNALAIILFNFLDVFGISPLTPEQYRIAGLDFVLNTEKIKNELGWVPTKDDRTMLIESLRNLIKSK